MYYYFTAARHILFFNIIQLSYIICMITDIHSHHTILLCGRIIVCKSSANSSRNFFSTNHKYDIQINIVLNQKCKGNDCLQKESKNANFSKWSFFLINLHNHHHNNIRAVRTSSVVRF
jgi:hypothetical protein